MTVLGSGDPWVTRAQSSGSILVEVGNRERDLLVLDLGSGSLANFASLRLPVNRLDKVFITHLHTDPTADLITLFGSYAPGRARCSISSGRGWAASGTQFGPATTTLIFADLRKVYDGPVVQTQDLTVFNITSEAVVARQAQVEPQPQPVPGKPKIRARGPSSCRSPTGGPMPSSRSMTSSDCPSSAVPVASSRSGPMRLPGGG